MSRFAILTTALTLTAVPVWADAPTPLKQAEASRVTYNAGVAARDPLLVVAAAKMRRNLGITPTDRTADGGQSGDSALDAAAMLEVAREFSQGDDLMLGLIDDVAAEQTKGVTDGPVYNIARIGGGKTDTYRGVPFNGGVYAEIYVEAKDSSDLNLKIFDSKNRLVCSDTDESAIAYCGWKPRADGTFTISVQNLTGGTVQYSLITN